MKTQITVSRNKSLKSLGILITFMFAMIGVSPVNAQTPNVTATQRTQNERIIKGTISDSNGPLESASIMLKGTKTGTSTDSKGNFTFPKPLKTGDVLLVSYLGFETVEAQIKDNTTLLQLTLTSELVEFVGALNTDKPYKSKRSN